MSIVCRRSRSFLAFRDAAEHRQKLQRARGRRHADRNPHSLQRRRRAVRRRLADRRAVRVERHLQVTTKDDLYFHLECDYSNASEASSVVRVGIVVGRVDGGGGGSGSHPTTLNGRFLVGPSQNRFAALREKRTKCRIESFLKCSRRAVSGALRRRRR